MGVIETEVPRAMETVEMGDVDRTRMQVESNVKVGDEINVVMTM